MAFLHMPSKSLIEADLLLNLPANEQVEYLPLLFICIVLTSQSVFKIILFAPYEYQAGLVDPQGHYQQHNG